MKEGYDNYILEIKKLLAWFAPTFLGILTKLAYDSRVKKITRTHVLTSLAFACFAGYISDKLCTKYALNDLRGVIVALAALVSESLVQYLLSNGNKIITVVFKKITGVDTNKKEEEK